MTDSTPANYYLIFNRSDEFETQDKIFYALKERDSIHRHHWDATLEEILKRKLLIRSMEELKRCVKISRLHSKNVRCGSNTGGKESLNNADSLSLSPASSSSSQESLSSSEDGEEAGPSNYHCGCPAPYGYSKAFPPPLSARGKPFASVTTIDAKPWESTGATIREWYWPIEVLYQHYHVHVVIDFLRVFHVSRNGHVFYDRIPDVVQCLMNSIKTMLQHRMEEKKEIAEWLPNSSNLSSEQQEKVLEQVWGPRVLVSITLINVPWHADGQVPQEKKKWKRYLKVAQGELLSPEMKNFSSCEPTKYSIVPILTRSDANRIVEDPEFHASFVKKLARMLGEYEKTSRGVPAAPGTLLSLESSIEYLVRSAPNTSKYCESIILVTNLNTCSCSSAISSLEGMVQRKNIIFSIVTLNREPMLDSPQLSALTYFVSHIGGFVVNIDFWRSLAQPSLNAAWSKRFEGSRCLIQQLFVQLINRFPRASRTPYLCRTKRDSVVVYQKTNTCSPNTQAYLNDNIANAILKALAVARFNENWTVMMYSPRSDDEDGTKEKEDVQQLSTTPRDRKLLAWSTHYFHQGSLTLEYELIIALPFFERRVSVRGTKTLVYQFCRAEMEARSRSQTTSDNSFSDVDKGGSGSETVGSVSQRGKVSYVENFCLHLREELLGEEVILQIMLEKAYSKQLLHFSCAKGVFYKWFNFAAVRSLAVCYDMSKRKDYSITPLPFIGLEGCTSRVVQCIEATLKEHKYVRIGKNDELAFIRQIDFQPYLVQFFPVGSNQEEPFKDHAAGCLECRISFFFWDWKKRFDVVKEMINILLHSSDSTSSSYSRRESDRVILRVFSHKKSQCLLGAMQELTIPRLELPPFHLSNSVVLGTSASLLPMRIPHPSFPFALKQALTFHWNFSEDCIYPIELRKKCFFFLLLRRRQTFDCLVSFGDSLKAILQRKDDTNDRGKESSDSELDFIDASGELATIKITRIITNVATACSSLPRDVEQDFKIFSALQTFYDKVSSQTSVRTRRIEPLLPYIPSDLDIVVLSSPKCFGYQGVIHLRQYLNRYLNSLDSSQAAESWMFPPSLVRALQTSGGDPTTQQNENFLSMIVSTKVVVSTNPIQTGSIVFAIMIADDSKCRRKGKKTSLHHRRHSRSSDQRYSGGSPSKAEIIPLRNGKGDKEVSENAASQLVVALVWMNYSRLSQELTSHYRQDTSVHFTRNEWSPVHISNRHLVENIRKDLAVRASLHSTIYLLQYFLAVDRKLLSLGQQERRSLDEIEISDLSEAVSHLTVFVDDLTGKCMAALYYVVESVVTSALLARQTSEEKTETDIPGTINRVLIYDVLSSILMQFCKSYAPLSSLCFPRESIFEGRESHSSFESIPILMKCALKVQEKGDEKRVDWIPCYQETKSSDNGVPPLQNLRNVLKNYIGSGGWTDRITRDKTSSKTLVLRLFLLSSMLEEDSKNPMSKGIINPVPYFTSKLIKESPPDSEFFLKLSNYVLLKNVRRTVVGVKLQHVLKVMQNELTRFCLQMSCKHQSYVEVLRLIGEEEVTGEDKDVSCLISSSGGFCARHDSSNNFSTSGVTAPAVTEKRFSILRHQDIAGCGKVESTPDLQRLLNLVVLPAVEGIERSCTLDDYIQNVRLYACEAAEDLSSSTSYSDDVLEVTVQEMFKKFAKEDGILLLHIENTCRHLLVPPRTHDCSESVWVFVDCMMAADKERSKVTVYGYSVDSASTSRTVTLCNVLLDYIKKKTTQFCQLQLLKKLRHTQQCSEKLLPPRWGVQFRRGEGNRNNDLQVPGRQSTSTLPSLQLHGKTVLQLPLYYKLQNQCWRVVMQIGRQCPRLELVPIENQPQCFLVADDNMEDVFHCFRFVFVLDYSSLVSTVGPSPPLTPTERCPRLVIQLFTAVDNPAVQRPLEKLQRFCYFLALQELQGQLNYAATLSFHDALFLQRHRREPLSIPYSYSNIIPSDRVGRTESKKRRGESYGNAETDGLLALSFVELHLRERNFKFFEVSEDMHSATSRFLEYYDLQTTEKRASEKVPANFSNGTKEGKKKHQLHTRRFVKLVEEITDVLVSCSVYIDPVVQSVLLVPYCTKEPLERFANMESEKFTLEELKSCEAGSRVLMQLYHRLQFHRKKVPLSALHCFLEDLLRMSGEVSLTDYRFRSFSIEEISPSTLPFLVERLCGALAPFKPYCFQYLENRSEFSSSFHHDMNNEGKRDPVHGKEFYLSHWTHLPSFPWKWVEHVQNDPLADKMEFYIMCGSQQVVAENGQVFPPTRVLPYVIPELLLGESKRADPCFRTSALNSLDFQMVLKVSMVAETLSIGFFNVRDVDIILMVCARIVEEMNHQSLLLREVLLQRLGTRVFESPFSELDLARHCCGDATNVIANRKLAIDSERYRRPRKTLRFPPSTSTLPLSNAEMPPKEAVFLLLLERLHNRGIVVNHVFPFDDGVKVLFDESEDLSVSCCERLMMEFISCGFLKPEESSALQPQILLSHKRSHSHSPQSGRAKRTTNCRVVLKEANKWTREAMIACSYHRHLFVAHIIIEAQNAQSSVQDLLSQCEPQLLQDLRDRKDENELAKTVVLLRSKSQEIFASRVPDFVLFPSVGNPADDVLEQTLPERSDEGIKHANAVDVILQGLTSHLTRVCPGAITIDLDPTCEGTLTESVLVTRLRCRYGKVHVEGSEEVIRFCPHLHYAVIPLYTLLETQVSICPDPILDMLLQEAKSSPISSCGLFVVEIGFQVSHYALDVFAIKGHLLSSSIVANLAADLRQRLSFENVLYDHQVHQIIRNLQHSSSPSSTAYATQQALPQAVSALLSVYPFAPLEAKTGVAALYKDDDSLIIRMKFEAKRARESSSSSPFQFLLPNESSEHVLVSPVTHQQYQYYGVASVLSSITGSSGGQVIGKITNSPASSAKTCCLFVLLLPVLGEEGSSSFYEPSRAPGQRSFKQEDFYSLFLVAKNKLVDILLRTTHEERVEFAWKRFFARPDILPQFPYNTFIPAATPPSFEDYQFVLNDAVKLLLPYTLQRIRALLEFVDFPLFSEPLLKEVANEFYPSVVLHIFTSAEAKYSSEGFDEKALRSQIKGTKVESSGQQRHCMPFGDMQPIVFVLAPVEEVTQSFLVAEGWSRSCPWDCSYRVDVEEISIIRRIPQSLDTSVTCGLYSCPATIPYSCSMCALLQRSENELVSIFQSIFTRAIWGATMWSFQY